MSAWRKHKLSQVTTIISGGTPKSGVSEYWGNDVRWITPKDMGQLTSEYVSDTGRRISKLGLDKSSAKLIASNSVILSTRAPIGHLAINTETMSTNQGCRGLTPTSDLHTKYLYYFLQGSVDLLNELGTGTTFKELSKTALEDVEIPLPPIPEQQRIVAILDQAFADIEKARANAEKNLKNARELFDSYLNQVFSQRGEGWASSQLKGITSKIGSGATPRGGKDSYKVEGTPLIRSMNVHDRRFVEKNIAFIDDEQADKLNNVVVEENDVLLNITGASVARCCVAHEDFLPARVNQHVSIIRVDKTKISPQFLNFLLTSKFYKDQLLGIGEAGSTRQAITKVQIENFTVDYPVQVSEQIELLEGLLSVENQALKVQKVYKNKLNSLDELKKSLLQKAFSGELTKTEGYAA